MTKVNEGESDVGTVVMVRENNNKNKSDSEHKGA